MQLRELVDAVTGDEPPMGRTVDDIVAAGRRAERRRRNRFATAGAAGLVAVAVASAITVPVLDARRTSSTLSEAPRPGVSPWPDASPFTFTFTGYDAGTLHVQDPIVVSTAYQIAPVYSDRHTSNDRPLTADEAESMQQETTAAGAKPSLWAYLTVYRPGAFAPAAIKGGRNVMVAGRRAVQATLPYALDPSQPPERGNKLFAWQYAKNAWAVVTAISGDEATPSFRDLSGLVTGLKPAGPTPAPLPFTVGYLPRGYVPLQVGTHALPGLSGIATARAGDYGGATYTRPPLRTSGLTAPFDSVEGGIRDGFHIFVTPSTSSNQSPEPGATRCYPGAARRGGFCNVWSADGSVVVQVSSEGVGGRLPQAELLRIAEGITVADDVRDESTWTPAGDALTP
ncbi:hypothetical protein AB0B11_07165 [Micromonospora tulbaghiae]|uniref:Uncharacterized protein n=1 Tax=Micromonospora tulbaghiae TaxID=479978 RepID=A0A386WIM6_9ACTN|nr:hypothetical protein [Micromonospora tulbaghiae]AYF28205.1 hypothetical protein CSH63_12245 [Micromonospora tulbaghiae]NED58141.1 hypothetical protein [Micromonospora aurantiaca]